MSTAWAARRPAAHVIHLDNAAASRPSTATLAATAEHNQRESTHGAYVVEDEAAATIEGCRRHLAALLGMPTDGVAFVESASAGLALLLRVGGLRPGDRVGVAAVEWGPNVEAFAAHGTELVQLPVDGHGLVDVAALESELRSARLDLVHLTHIASHRGAVQPVGAIVEVAHAAGVPVWVDAAQALGHVSTDSGADAVYATSRKWLAGPRGIGLVATAEHVWPGLRVVPSALAPPGLPPMRYLDSHDAHIAGRVGLANAVTELIEDGPHDVFGALAELGRDAREILRAVRGWTVDDGSGAIIALRPTGRQDVVAVRASLLEE